MYVQKKNKKGFLETGLEGSVGILSKMNFSFEFFQSVHLIILKVSLSAGVWFRPLCAIKGHHQRSRDDPGAATSGYHRAKWRQQQHQPWQLQEGRR